MICGGLLLTIGGALLISPMSFLASSEVFVQKDPSLLSEFAASSGVLIFAGALMIFSAIKMYFIESALFVGAMVYLTYGLGRLLGVFFHGVPSTPLVMAMVIELIVGGVLLTLGLNSHRRQILKPTHQRRFSQSYKSIP